MFPNQVDIFLNECFFPLQLNAVKLFSRTQRRDFIIESLLNKHCVWNEIVDFAPVIYTELDTDHEQEELLLQKMCYLIFTWVSDSFKTNLKTVNLAYNNFLPYTYINHYYTSLCERPITAFLPISLLWIIYLWIYLGDTLPFCLVSGVLAHKLI